ncbi:unnamed protein product [Ascophyllum nodosum]
MLGLRRSITYLWTLAPRGGGDGNGDDMRLQTPRSVDEGACHPQLAGSSRAVMKRGRDQEEEGNSSTSGMRHDEPQPPAIREVTLSYPWGGHDSRPPRGWSTAAHEDPNRTKSLLLQRGVSSPQFHFFASAGNNDWDSCLPSPIKRPRDHAQEENLRSRRRRPSKTNGTYVSPSQPPLPEMDAEAELQLLRSWPPPRLTFRADLIRRAVSGRGTAVRRPMSRSRRRELDDALVRRAYDATHPSASEGKEDREGQQDSRALEDARRARQEKEEAFWRRLRRVEEEEEKEVEEMVASRWKNLERLRAEVNTELADALAAKERVITSATAAFEAAPGPDMTTLRSLFGGTEDSSTLLKDDREVQQLRQRFLHSEGVLNEIKEAQAGGDWSKLEKLLATADESGLKSQREFVSARQALRSAKDRATKAAKDQAAKDDRGAAGAGTTAPAPTAAPTAPGMMAGHRPEAIEQETVQPVSTPTFLERAEGLKKAVEAHRALSDALMASPDTATKKIRMAFMKACQDSFNKLACCPSSVSLVMSEIHEKVNDPLTEARMGGYIDTAQEFFLYNIADKLVVYAERDQFSAESYRMAFPLACVAVDLMTEHQHLAEIFLGRLFAGCPSAVPALTFNTASMSDTEVMSLLGKLEGENMRTYLNRTKGLIVLMAAIMQTPARRSGELPHPLPLTEGWHWITRFLDGLTAYMRRGSRLPVPTGPVLEWFLKVAGFELQRRYGKAFHDVVLIIKTDVLPILLPKSMVPHLLDVVIQDYESTGCRLLPPAAREREFGDFRAWGET